MALSVVAWEWTRDWYGTGAPAKAKGSCCVAANPRGAKLRDSIDPSTPQVRIGRKVPKGGSHLCAVNYCQRYRPAARHPEAIDSATSHIGFRCVVRELLTSPYHWPRAMGRRDHPRHHNADTR
jgi:formylglycine-generating enzyme